MKQEIIMKTIIEDLWKMNAKKTPKKIRIIFLYKVHEQKKIILHR